MYKIFFLIVALITTPLAAQELPTPKGKQDGTDETGAPKSMTEKASFVIGYNIAMEWKDQAIEVDFKQMARGILAASNDQGLGMTDEEIQSVMNAFQKELMKRNEAQMREMMAVNQKQGEEFLDANGKKDGVENLPNGSQVLVLKAAEGEPPLVDDRIRFHFKESAIDGTVFQSTFGGEPEVYTVGTFPIRGIVYALQRMAPGAKWQIVLPADLAYGMYGSPNGVGPSQTLIYEVELVEILEK